MILKNSPNPQHLPDWVLWRQIIFLLLSLEDTVHVRWMRCSAVTFMLCHNGNKPRVAFYMAMAPNKLANKDYNNNVSQKKYGTIQRLQSYQWLKEPHCSQWCSDVYSCFELHFTWIFVMLNHIGGKTRKQSSDWLSLTVWTSKHLILQLLGSSWSKLLLWKLGPQPHEGISKTWEMFALLQTAVWSERLLLSCVTCVHVDRWVQWSYLQWLHFSPLCSEVTTAGETQLSPQLRFAVCEPMSQVMPRLAPGWQVQLMLPGWSSQWQQ